MKSTLRKYAALAALTAVMAPAANAQQADGEAQDEFVPHWFIQAQAGVSATRGEASFSDLLSPSVQFALGRQFTPCISARVKASGWQAKGGWVNPSQIYTFKQAGLQADVRLDLTSLFGGYSATRPVSVGLFAGGGANMAWDNGEACTLKTHGYELPYLWTEHKLRAVGSAGVDANIRLSDRVSLGLELNAHIINDHFNSKKAGNADWMFNALAGVRINLGKTRRAKTVPATVVVPVQSAEQPAEQRPVTPDQPGVRQEVKPAPKADRIREDIFFAISSAQLTPQEQAKVNNLVAFLKQHTSMKVTLQGYADKGTGNADINMAYSKQRVAAVKALLLKAGIAESRILTEAHGDTWQPFRENDKNRVCICISE